MLSLPLSGVGKPVPASLWVGLHLISRLLLEHFRNKNPCYYHDFLEGYFQIGWLVPTIHTFFSPHDGSVVKNPPAMQETQIWSLGREDPLEEEMATHSSILAWKILQTEDPGGPVQRVAKSWTQLSNWAQILLFGVFRPLMFKVPIGTVELISPIFTTVFYLLFMFFVPIFLSITLFLLLCF